jgi:hypothetical protein
MWPLSPLVGFSDNGAGRFNVWRGSAKKIFYRSRQALKAKIGNITFHDVLREAPSWHVNPIICIPPTPRISRITSVPNLSITIL